ncbi:UDP-3-O-acyl-N-acetylglucosamine deacetylase [Roseomonas gilardii subsp. gilardii]|uniref:UDP-3-O-acyl-N-acetylglucosamine deacetylase n=1 Tax=Roseomonas gilardii TaxID=257708 RepID=UPI001FF8A701|nr:UDP-3-O-acyl-N-acetylglucosamine deacetylase [Roseomonas gilardii]UPG72323.1 UDP-3-O-acyl-N-acetylglucosamine deacetylase [Roseomonas gilardii subsp. gilardii]
MDGSLLSVTGARKTLKASIGCVGTGLHSGDRVSLTLRPAEAGTGILFRRTDLGVDIPARYDLVTDTRLCTALTCLTPAGEARIGTVEHVLAALAGCGVDDCIIEVDAPEIPILDGSAAPFVFLIDCAGVTAAAPYAPRDTIEVLKPIRVEEGSAWAELHPNSRRGMEISLAIAFEGTAVGRQDLSLPVTPDSFREVLADARTFTMAEDVARLRAVGLARGGSLANAVVVDGPLVLNPGGLRHPQEFVRHKMMDVVGDLFLAGAPLRACFRGHKSGHSLNNRLLRALFADPTAWRIDSQATENASAAANARLPLAAAPA